MSYIALILTVQKLNELAFHSTTGFESMDVVKNAPVCSPGVVVSR